jgi:magnesium and cobalt transporter
MCGVKDEADPAMQPVRNNKPQNDNGADEASRPRLVEKTQTDTDGREKSSFLKRIGSKLKRKSRQVPDASLKEALEEVLEEHEQSAIMMAPEEKTMFRNMLEFADLTVSDIMVPRTDILAVEDTITLDNLKKHVLEQRHTRIPVYSGTLDTIRGFIHIKDLVPMLSGDEPYDLGKLIRHMPFIPPSMRIIDLLFTMRHSGSHMAIVIDEYGGTDGLVTMEDLVEEIVGEIQDEHDDEEQEELFVWVSENIIEADARVRVDRLEEEMQVTIRSEEDDDDFDTIGGLIFFHLGRVPARGEVVSQSAVGLKFEILEADSRRIRKVRITRIKPAASLLAE